MRILVISNLYPPGFQGGYELGCSHMARALGAAGHDVCVLTSPPIDDAVSDAEGAVRTLRMERTIFDDERLAELAPADRRALEARARGVDAENVRALEHELARFEPDVAYLWNLLGIGGLGLLAQLERRAVPWVWHLMDAVPNLLCGPLGRPDRDCAAALHRLASGSYLACSTHVVAEIRAGGIELAGPVALVPNWIAGALPGPRATYYDGGPLRLVSAVAVLGEHKGTDILIDAVAALRADGHEVRLDLYGRAADDRFGRRIADRGVGDAVRLCGLVPQHELAASMASYDVFAFPTHWREPFAFAPLEAAAAGCVPLISACSGNAEWMVHGVHCLKAHRSVAGFAEAIAEIARGEHDLAAIGRRAQRIVRNEFHLPALVPGIERALGTAASSPRRGGGADRADDLATAARAMSDGLED